MEGACLELRHTLDLAIEYDESKEKKVALIQSHVRAIEEDLNILMSFKTTDKEQEKQINDLAMEARRVRRSLEREALQLHEDNKLTEVKTEPQILPIQRELAALKLQPLKIPIFRGDITKFRSFYETFKATILNNSSIPDMGKWLYLRESLEGIPAELIRGIPETTQTLEIALKMLKQKYGDKDTCVTQLYKQLQEIVPSSMNTEKLRLTYAQIEGVLLSLEEMGHPVNENGYIRSVVLGKLPAEVLYQIVQPTTTLAEVRNRLNDFILARECVANQSIFTEAPKDLYASFRSRRFATENDRTSVVRKFTCIFCTGQHWSDECPEYITVSTRKEKLIGKCFRCLRNAHPNTDCAIKRRCAHCDEMSHNRALCPKKFGLKTEKILLVNENSKILNETSENKGLYWTFMIPVHNKGCFSLHKLRVVIDPGSSKSLISKAAAKQLGLSINRSQVAAFCGLGNTPINIAHAALQKIAIQTTENEEVDIDVYIVDAIADKLRAPNISLFKSQYPEFNHLHILESGENNDVDLLIGNDKIVSILTTLPNLKITEDLQLMPTKFGYILIGTQKVPTQVDETILLLPETNSVSHLWDFDNIGLQYIENKDNIEEDQALNNFYKNLTFKDNRYVVGWPWRDYPPALKDNYGLAFGRLVSLWKNLRSQPEILKQYNNILIEQEKTNIIEKVIPSSPVSEIIRYIPHHPVISVERSTKIRLVYDASAKTSKNDKSLNDCLLKGTKWLNDISLSLLKFRTYDVAIISDVEKAFHQLVIQENDRDVVRFLWLKNIYQPPSKDNLVIFRFQRVAFGVVSSPFLLYATIQHHLSKYKSDTAKILRTDMYADNLVTAIPSSQDPLHFYKEAKYLFNSMSMNLTKWSSNNTALLSNIPETDKQSAIKQLVLGLLWDTKNDMLSLKKPAIKHFQQQKLTKRVVLSQAAAVFDPLGWAAPITLCAKLFIRRLWSEKRSWDTDIENEYLTQWQKIKQNLETVDQIQLPRMMFNNYNENNKYELHVFVDASIEACAVVIYVVNPHSSPAAISFLAAKSKLAPKSGLTIPRLELLAAVLGARFSSYIIEALKWSTNIDKYLWIDSKCVLNWLKNNKVLPVIVQRQIEEIRKHGFFEYKYVPSHDNFADIATRGATIEMLFEQNWWNGPTWLLNKKEWPSTTLNVNEEIGIDHLLLHIDEEITSPDQIFDPPEYLMGIIITNFSSLYSLLKRTATCIRALNLLLKRDIIQTQQDYDTSHALFLWIRWQQRISFPELQNLKINETKLYKNIRVFCDKDNLIRAATRITHANIEINTINPLLLPRNTHLTQLIVLDIHTKNKHTGVSQTLAFLRTNYWLPQGRREIYKIIHSHCFICRKFLAKLYAPPPPAPLPEFRVQKGVKPFHAVGIDIFGPFSIRQSSPRPQIKEKRWILIFVCTVVRAVHLEILSQLTAVEIVDAFRRFTSRRGVPRQVVSDNAPQFRVIQGRLVNLWQHMKKEDTLTNYFCKNQILWKFIPQQSPWMGGLYERLIKSVKNAFETTYGRIILAERQFTTSIIEIEAVLNSRPLIYVSQEKDAPILTPNNFLQVEFSAIDISTAPNNRDYKLFELWKSSQQHLDAFWSIWSQEYLASLRERDDQLRNPRSKAKSQPEVGGIVLIAEPEKRRSAWIMAKIIRLIPSADGQIRSLLLRLPNGSSTIRPVIKTAPIGLHVQPTPLESRQLTADNSAFVFPATGENDVVTHQPIIGTLPDRNENYDVEILGIDDLPSENMEKTQST